MASGLSSPSTELPRLQIVGLGGTIMSRIQQEDIHSLPIIKPHKGAIPILLSQTSDAIKDRFLRISESPSEHLIDSAQVKAKKLQEIILDIRNRLKCNVADRFIILYGSDSTADLMGALGNAISPEELGDKSIIVTCSMQHLEADNSDAVVHFRRSMVLACNENIRGKVGLLFGERFFPPRGIEKVQLTKQFPFISRYHRIAKFYPEDGQWVFRDHALFDDVRGKPDEKFRLIDGVEERPVTTTTNYANIPDSIKENRATVLVGLGNGNIRTDSSSIRHIKRAAREAKGPIVVVGRSIHNAEDNLPPVRDWQDAVYDGDASFIDKVISAGAMTPTEARILISQVIANAHANNLLDKSAITALVNKAVTEYPFLTMEQSRWNKDASIDSAA